MNTQPLIAPLRADKRVAVHASVVAQAAEWLVRLHGDADERTRRACDQWRQADPSHELAWQRLSAMSRDFNRVGSRAPAGAASRTVLAAGADQARRRSLKWMFAGIGAGGAALWLCRDPQALWTDGDRYQTAVGEQREVTLSDGSALALNTGTNLYVQFTRHERRILLREGEIQVTTAPDPEGRGFKVVTRNGELVPLGTRFIVRDHADNGRQSLVAVQQGAVAIHAGGVERVVRAGEQALFGPAGTSAVAPLDTATAAWTDGMLVANRMRLDRFLAELGRYRQALVQCESELAGKLVTGAFRLDNTDEALALLARVLGVRVRYRTRYWVSVVPA